MKSFTNEISLVGLKKCGSAICQSFIFRRCCLPSVVRTCQSCFFHIGVVSCLQYFKRFIFSAENYRTVVKSSNKKQTQKDKKNKTKKNKQNRKERCKLQIGNYAYVKKNRTGKCTQLRASKIAER